MHIQFFSPASNVWAHSYPESLLMKHLSNSGHVTSRVSCSGVFQTSCPAFNELGINNTGEASAKLAICRSCKKRRNLLERQFDYISILLDDVVNSTVLDQVENLIQSVTPKNWIEFSINDVAFGKLASYEFSLHHKDVSLNISAEKFPEYLNYLRTTLISYLGGIEILTRTKPDVVVLYNSLYSINAGYEQAALRLGISTYTVQGGPHLVDRSKTLIMYRSIKDLFRLPQSDSWNDYSKKPLSEYRVAEVIRHLNALLDGASPWAYSAPIGSNNANKFPKNSILILTSSEDELAAGRLVDAYPELPFNEGFSSQTEWLKSIIEIARDIDHLNFIIRVHPRMSPNKRDSKTAPFIQVIDELIASSPPNVFLNLPTDNISLYEMINNVSLALNYGSSAGIEFLCFGVPVINAVSQDFLVAPMDICFNAKNHYELKQQILKHYGSEFDVNHAINAFRWFSFQFNRSTRFVFKNNVSSFSQIRPKKIGLSLKLWNIAVRLIITRFPTVLERRQIAITKSDVKELKDFESLLVNRLSGLHEIERTDESAIEDDRLLITESIKLLRNKVGV
jgi:hypothetical protein